MNLTIIRHASVEEKYLGCYNGHIDIGLSQQGILDAKGLKKQINPNDYDAVYCSNLKRAIQTADALELKDIIYTDALREKSWGEHEGKSFDEIGIEYENFTQYIDALGGESVEDFVRRVKSFLYSVPPHKRWNKSSISNILIITHSGVIKTLLSFHENISLEDAFNKNIPYLSITRIKIENI